MSNANIKQNIDTTISHKRAKGVISVGSGNNNIIKIQEAKRQFYY